MTSPEQAMAARLTAIAERLERPTKTTYVGQTHHITDLDDLRFLSAHVETLTQQVADETKLRLSQRIDIDTFMAQIRKLQQENARLTEERNAAARTVIESTKAVLRAEQENARLRAELAEHRESLATCADHISGQRAIIVQAEQQRDAAHAALKELREFSAAVLRVFAEHNEATFDTIIAEAYAAGVKDGFGKRADAALAASAPQKEK